MDKSFLNRNKFGLLAIAGGMWIGSCVGFISKYHAINSWQWWVICLPMMILLGWFAAEIEFYRRWLRDLFEERNELRWMIREYKRKGHDQFMKDLIKAASVIPPEVTKH